MKIYSEKPQIIGFLSVGLTEGQHKSTLSSKPFHHSGLCVPEVMRVNESVHKLRTTATTNDSIKMNKSVNKSANVCFGGFFNANKIYTSSILKKGLGFAADNGALFLAGVAFVTGAILRPIAILATPGVKKRNKEYASANSISSSVIGLGLMALASTPIATAIKKINNNPEKYISADTIKRLTNGKNLVSSSKYKFATQIFKLGSDFVCAIPKALLTCALIPPIISLFFPKKEEQNTIIYPSSAISFKAAQFSRSKQIFKGFIKEG